MKVLLLLVFAAILSSCCSEEEMATIRNIQSSYNEYRYNAARQDYNWRAAEYNRTHRGAPLPYIP